MFVSIALICKRLSGLFSFIVHGNPSDELNLLSAEFLRPNTIPQNDIIYVVDLLKNEESIPNFRYQALITVGKPDEQLIQQCECLLEFPETECVQDVFNAVSAVFSYYNRWDNQLQQVIKTQGSIQNLLDCSVEIFGNPIGIHNAALECIAETNVITEADDLKLCLIKAIRGRTQIILRAFLRIRNFNPRLTLKAHFFKRASWEAITWFRTFSSTVSFSAGL